MRLYRALFIFFPGHSIFFADRFIYSGILQPCRSGLEGSVLLVAAEVAPAKDACSTDALLGHGEKDTGWEAAAGAIPTSLILQGKNIFSRNHCSSGVKLQMGENLPYRGSFLSSDILRYFCTFSSLFAFWHVEKQGGKACGDF